MWYSRWPEVAPVFLSSASSALSSAVSAPEGGEAYISKLTVAMHQPVVGFVDIDGECYLFQTRLSPCRD